nr:hypothetical protein [Tanacetum cinerariifolium]
MGKDPLPLTSTLFVHPLALIIIRKKSRKSQTVTSTLPKSQGPKASGALSKKSKRPKFKNPPTKTKVISPKPTEGFGKSHSVSSGTVPDPQDLERDIQLASTRLPSTLDEGTRQSQPFHEGTVTLPKDSRGNVHPLDRELTSTTSDEGTTKTTSHSEGSIGDKDSGGNIPPVGMEPIHTTVADLSGVGAKYQVDETQSTRLRGCAKYQVDETQSTRLRYQSLTKNKGKPSSEVEPDIEPLHLQTYSDIQAFLLTEDELEKESDDKEVLTAEEDMDEDPQAIDEISTPPPNQDQSASSHTDKLVEASMSSLDKSSTTISDLYKGLDVITQLLKNTNHAVKDDPATNNKINDAIKTFAKIFTQTTKILSLVKTFDFSTLQSTLIDLQDQALKQVEAPAAWKKSSTNMSWSLDSRMTVVKISQTALKSEVSSLRQDTSEIKSMMTEIYQAFKGQPSSAPLGSVTPTLAITHIPTNVKGENATNTATEKPPFHTKGETGDTIM